MTRLSLVIQKMHNKIKNINAFPLHPKIKKCNVNITDSTNEDTYV
jgi:hypothetical protein